MRHGNVHSPQGVEIRFIKIKIRVNKTISSQEFVFLFKAREAAWLKHRYHQRIGKA